MARLLAMYKTPKDAVAFDKYYFETHVPIAKKIPGLRKYEVSQGTVATPAGKFHESKVADLEPPHYVYLIWVRYRSAGRDFARPLPAQLWYGVNATVSNPSAALIAFRCPCRPDCERARRTLTDFSVSAVPR